MSSTLGKAYSYESLDIDETAEEEFKQRQAWPSPWLWTLLPSVILCSVLFGFFLGDIYAHGNHRSVVPCMSGSMTLSRVTASTYR